jgi:anti-anti-sigma factor
MQQGAVMSNEPSPAIGSAVCGPIDCHGAAIDVVEHGRVIIVAVTGEIDAVNAVQFDAGLGRFAGAARPMVIDLSGVVFFGVAGLRALLHFDDMHRRSGAAWLLVAGPLVHRLLGVAGRGTARMAGTVDEAVRQLSTS